MKILFVAPTTFSRITIFISQYIKSLEGAAKFLGHDVETLQTTEIVHSGVGPNQLRQIFHNLGGSVKGIAHIPQDVITSYHLFRAVNEFKPDIIFLHLIDSSYMHLTVNRIRQRGICVLTWLGIHPSRVSSGVHKLLGSSDYTLIYDPSYADYYSKQLNIHNTRIVPLGCDVAFHDSVNIDESFKKEKGVDVCFIGLFDEHREKYLKELTGFDLGIWSWNMEDYRTRLKQFHRGTVYGESLIKVLKSSKIVLNIHRDFEISGGNYRLFEIPASRAFQLVDEKEEIGRYFDIGREIVTFKDEQDLKKKVEYYLRNPEEREQIAEAGYQRVIKEHSIIDRMNRIINLAVSGKTPEHF